MTSQAQRDYARVERAIHLFSDHYHETPSARAGTS